MPNSSIDLMNSKTNNPMTEIFNFMSHKVRVVVTEGVPWFVAVDACRCMGMDLHAGAARWTAGVSPTEKRTILREEYPQIFRGFRGGALALLSESGLYKMIMRSNKPQAKAFQDWVTGTVLPAIRKDGMYVQGEEKVSAGEMDLEELTLLTMSRLQDKMKRLQAEKEAERGIKLINTPNVRQV